ncbi:MAG TPA: MerR family transcriptional regulator [Gemmatimonadales bacterium]|nr:MerR family transcriptional regulator [Gemmatimonadales bacterium]
MVEPVNSVELRHPVRVVTERTGLSADVLRAWERRHGVVKPARSEGGQRLYSDADIDRLALLAKATQVGRSVSHVAAMSTEELTKLVADDAARAAERPVRGAPHVDAALAAVGELAPERLHAILRRALLSVGAPEFLSQVLAPLLEAVGSAWEAGTITVAEEHAASQVVQQLLVRLIEELEAPGSAPVLVLATPAHERHTLGALMAGAAAALDGWRVVWLGADLPAAQIAEAARIQRARVVALSVAMPASGSGVAAELGAVRAELDPATTLMVGGAGAPALARDLDGVVWVGDLADWRARLGLSAPPRQRTARH